MPATLALSAVDSATAGQELVVTVTASAPADGVQVALVRTEKYRQKASSSGNDTDYTSSTTEAAIDLAVELIPEVEVTEQVDVAQLIDVGRLDGTREVRIALPDDLPPTTPDLVGWTLRAFGTDGATPTEQPVAVVSAAVPAEEAPRFTGTGDGDSEQLRLEFPGGVAMVRAGDTLRGALVIEPRKSAKLTEVRLKLELLHRDEEGFRRMGTLVKVDV